MKLLAKNFQTRTQLETEIERLPAEQPIQRKITVSRLQLSDVRTVWGWAVICTDTPTERVTEGPPRPDRGEIFESGSIYRNLRNVDRATKTALGQKAREAILKPNITTGK
jgi:hypothetical protein